jgi:hypothetical protein
MNERRAKRRGNPSLRSFLSFLIVVIRIFPERTVDFGRQSLARDVSPGNSDANALESPVRVGSSGNSTGIRAESPMRTRSPEINMTNRLEFRRGRL